MGLCRGAVLPTTVGCLLLFEFMKKEAFQRYLLNDHLIPGASRSLARVPFPQEGPAHSSPVTVHEARLPKLSGSFVQPWAGLMVASELQGHEREGLVRRFYFNSRVLKLGVA